VYVESNFKLSKYFYICNILHIHTLFFIYVRVFKKTISGSKHVALYDIINWYLIGKGVEQSGFCLNQCTIPVFA
jgi:hypothetical protein